MNKAQIKNTYSDLIHQTFFFPRHGFEVKENRLFFHGIDMQILANTYGTPLKFTYLPKIGEQINKARDWFKVSIDRHNYPSPYVYCYCTKSSHFSFVMEEVVKNGSDLETSSSFDLEIVRKLNAKGLYDKDRWVICNGFKTEAYMQNISKLFEEGFKNTICVLDSPDEVHLLKKHVNGQIQVGIRIATEEEPNFSVYTSRMGTSYKKLNELYLNHIATDPNIKLRMIHFFVNSGIRDTTFYWSELSRIIQLYCDLKEICPELDTLDIGGGLPIYTSLGVEYDYAYMIDQIVLYIKTICESRNVPPPTIISEFGSFTVGESGGILYSVIGQKEQNDKELWYMIDSSFITTLPDTWGIGQKFILLAVNHWDKPFKRINMGGLTCDGQDFYNSETHSNQVFMPVLPDNESLLLGFFHTGAYQESLGGYGGIQHCLIPAPKHLIINKDENGHLNINVFAEEQKAESMLNLLGY